MTFLGEIQMSTAIEKLTLEECLELEQRTGLRHEFQHGEVTPMVGGSRVHSKIIAQFSGELYQLLKATQYEVHVSDMRYYAAESDKYTFPDIVIPDEPAQFIKPVDTLTNPLLIVEVLSPSTASYDRTEKFDLYAESPSFQEFLLVSQHTHRIEQFVRQPNDKWERSVTTDPQSKIQLATINCELAVSDIYADVDFSQAEVK